MNPADFLEPPSSYKSFNEFFFRKLKPEARPIAASPVVFPADGRHLGFSDISKIDSFFVKGQTFDLPALLGDSALAAKYAHGSLVLSRLCPVDYHRFHFPAAGIPSETRTIPGPLFYPSPLPISFRISGPISAPSPSFKLKISARFCSLKSELPASAPSIRPILLTNASKKLQRKATSHLEAHPPSRSSNPKKSPSRMTCWKIPASKTSSMHELEVRWLNHLSNHEGHEFRKNEMLSLYILSYFLSCHSYFS